MDNKIREILDDFRNDVENNLYIEVRGIYYKPLLDYITNLQQELNKKTKRCTERNHRIRCRDRKLERRDKKIANLQQENERLKEWKEDLLNENIELENTRKEAIEFIKEKISSTKGVINDYMYHKEHNKQLIELLNEDIEMYKNELNILQNGSEK